MTRPNFISCLLLFCLVLTSCGGNVVTRPAVLRDAESYTNAGLDAFAEANWKNAQLLLTRALSLYQGIDYQQGVMLSHINLAEVALVLDDYPAVEKHLDSARTIANRTSQADVQSRISLLFSHNALKQNQTNLAKKRLQPLMPEFNDVNPVSIASHIQLVAIADRTKIAFVENSNASLWTHRYANALMLSDIKDSGLESRLLRFQAVLLQQQGNLETAESNLQKALIKYKNNLSRPGIAVTLSELGQLYMIQGRWQDAQEYIKRAMVVYRYLKNAKKISRLNKTLAEVETHLANLNSGK